VQQNRDGEQNLYKQFGLFSTLLLLLSVSLSAGSFEDFKRTQNTHFTNYKDKRDGEFNNYLKTAWQEYTAKTSKALYERPKPKSIEPTVERKIQDIGPLIHIQVQQTVKQKEVKRDTLVSKVENSKDVSFDFFGELIAFDVDAKIKPMKFYPQNQQGISNVFSLLASSNYEDTVAKIDRICKSLNLNDWGVYLLVTQFSQELFTKPDESQLFAWFIFNKLGYDVKIGLSKKHIVLLHYSKKLIYSTPAYSFDKKKYYHISEYSKSSKSRVYTYEQSYPDAEKALDLGLKTLPFFAEDFRKRELHFEYLGKEYLVAYRYNQNLINFMATYPQADYETFFNAPLSKDIYEDVAKSLKQYLDGQRSSSAINFVLAFVQKSFIYERDDLQFGREKVMFAYETLYYDKSDCEDRATLFAYLVKELFNIGVVGVKYKDHMATALYIPMKGDSVMKNGRRFVIADPTYVNANIGQSMPKYRARLPESFIVVEKER